MIRRLSLAQFLLILSACSESSEPAGPGPEIETEIEVPAPDDGLQLKMAATIPAAQEVTYCQYFRMPEDRTIDITRFEHQYTQGSHHLLLVRVDPTTPPPEGMFACGTSEALNAEDRPSGMIYGAQSPTGKADLPEGVAMELEAGSTILMQAHYLNTTTEDLDATMTVNLWFMDPADVRERAGTLFFFNPFIYLPGGGEASTTLRCPVPAGTKILSATSHMHKRGVGFEAFLQPGTSPDPIYRTTQWSDPVSADFYDAPLDLTADSQIEFTCRYRNDGQEDVSVGFSADTDEMCVFAALYYPIQDRAIEQCTGGQFVGAGNLSCADTLGCAQDCGDDRACMTSCTTNVCADSSGPLTSAIMCLVNECATSEEGGAGCAIEQCGAELLACNNAGC